MPAIKHYDKAIQTIDNIITIARNEQLKRGQYVFDEVDGKLAAEGAICGGHKACMIGSTAIGFGFPLRDLLDTDHDETPSAKFLDEHNRPKVLKSRPALRLAYNALNAAADDRLPATRRGEAVYRYHKDYYGDYYEIDKQGREYAAQCEEFFERTLGRKSKAVIHAEVISLCNDAKRLLRRDRKREHG